MTNVEICNAFTTTFNTSDWDGNMALLADNVTYMEYATGRELTSKGTWLEASQGWKIAFPDAKGTILNTVESGNTVVQELTWERTHTGNMHTPDGQIIPPTGKKQVTPAVMIMTIEDGKITRANHYFDMLSMMAQLGLAG